jgi:predicted lipase
VTTSSDEGFVGYSRSARQVVVSWRGTDNLPGWIADAEFGLTGYPGAPPGIRVHSGFLQSANGAAGQVRQIVSLALARCGPQCSVTVTGHSLGGALATLSAVDLALFNGIRAPIDLYVFGSPRVGNSAFVAWFQQVLSGSRRRIRNVMRVTNGGDLVAHLPPRSFFGLTSYSHIAREVWHTSAGYKLCDMSGEDPTCGDSVSTFDLSALDHGKYMGKSALDGVLHRCMWTDPQTK